MSADTFYLALCLAFVGFAILVIVTFVSARYNPEAEQRRELERLANWLAWLAAEDEAAGRPAGNGISAQGAELIRQQNPAVYDDGT